MRETTFDKLIEIYISDDNTSDWYINRAAVERQIIFTYVGITLLPL